MSDAWRVAHAWSALPGWLVLIPRRHLTSLAELTEPEGVELGQLLRATSAALEAEVGCSKTYTMMFAEQPGFEHVHFHVVPRMPDFSPEHLGPGVVEFISGPREEWVADDKRDELASALAKRLDALLSEGE